MMKTELNAKLQLQKKKVWVFLLCCGGLILLLNGSHATRAASGLFKRIERGIASRGAGGFGGLFFQTPTISMMSSVSGCYYSGGQSRKTVSVEVAWSSLPSPVTITVSLPGAIGSTTKTISAQTTGNPPIVSPQVVAFEIPSTFTGTLEVSAGGVAYPASSVPITTSGDCAPLVCAASEIGGTVYSDYNGDGTRNPGDNPGVANVTVTGYDNTGMSYTTTSNSEGKYCLSVPSANFPVRVEFTSLPRSSGRDGTNSASSVQFVNAPTQNVDLSISTPDGYCENNPWVMTSCYVFGDPLASSSTAATEPALVRARYLQDGITTGIQSFANAGEIGATFGIAYQKQSDRLFTSAILRRHSGFGPRGLGGIYVLNANSSSNTISATGNVVDSWSVIDQLGVEVAPKGSILDGTSGATINAARGLVADRTLPSRDIDAFASVGKIGIGDIDLTPDGNTLFFINQFDQLLYSVDISGYNPANTATRPTATNLLSKNTATAVTCSNGVWRPSALKVTSDYAYVGGVCDGSTGTRSDLRAKVLRIPLRSGTWNTQSWSTVLDFPLTYPKGYAHGVFKDLAGDDSVKMWRTWTDNFFDLEIRPNPSLTVTSTTPALVITSVPLLSDIEIDVDGSIILSIGDRTGLQLGNINYGPVAAGTTTLATTSNKIDRQGAMTNSDNVICPIQFSGSRNLTGNTFYTNAVGGDILRGLIAGSSSILENGGRVGSLTGSSTSNNEGPGFGEFYADNFAYPSAPVPPGQFCSQDPHTEIAMGGLAVLPGSGEVVMTAMDPRDERSGETAQVNAGGFRYLNNSNGTQTRSLVIYSLGDDQSIQLGKSSGLGDVELSCGVINY